jgi:hypothetical protein
VGRNNAKVRGIVLLRAFDIAGDLVEESEVSYDRFYEESVPLIDDGMLRSRRGVRRIEGKVYGSSGDLQQGFNNEYDAAGKYIHGRTVHKNGAVVED